MKLREPNKEIEVFVFLCFDSVSIQIGEKELVAHTSLKLLKKKNGSSERERKRKEKRHEESSHELMGWK